MKKFLINFIIGVILMAIGTTALVFELNEFEYVDTEKYIEQNALYKNETISLKDNETLQIDFLDDDYGYSYEWNYDDSLKDRVKISFANGVNYRVSDRRVEIIDIDGSSDNGFGNGWERFRFMLEGLKDRKLYNVDNSHVLITTSHENRNRININSYYE